MLPREQQSLLTPLTCVCIGVYGIDRITLERKHDQHSSSNSSSGPNIFDVTLAGIELPGGSGAGAGAALHPVASSSAAPFYVIARDWLRRQLIGIEITFAPVIHRVGHIYVGAAVDPMDVDADEMMVNGQLVRQGFAVARTFPAPSSGTVVNPKSAGERRKAWFKNLEDQAREKGAGYHGVGRLSDTVRVVKPFPEPEHPYRSLLVHHLQSADSQKFTVESVMSPFLLTCVHSRSYQEMQVRICGIAASRIETYFQQARWAVIRALLHREIVFTFHGFDAATQSFWARIVSHHGDVVNSMVERGIMTFDDRCAALPTSYVETLVSSQSVAQSLKLAVWSSSSTPASGLAAPSRPMSLSVLQPTLHEITGTVQAVSDNSSFELAVDHGNEDEGTVAQPHLVSIAHLLAPISSSESNNGLQDDKRVKYVDHGVVVTYSARAFYGRETLRKLLIGRRVRVTGTNVPSPGPQQRSTLSAVDIVILPTIDDDEASSSVFSTPTSAASIDVIAYLLSCHPYWYSIPRSTLPFPLVNSAQEVPPLHLLLQTLTTTAAVTASISNRNETLATSIAGQGDGVDDVVVLTSETKQPKKRSPARREKLVKSTKAAEVQQQAGITADGPEPMYKPVGVLYVQTPQHLRNALRSAVLPLGVSLPCLVEGLHCWVDSTQGTIRLKLEVYLTTVGAVVPVMLEGLQLPSVAASNDATTTTTTTIAIELLRSFSGRLKAFLTHSILHREANVTLLAQTIEPHHRDGQKPSEDLLSAVIFTQQFLSLLHGLLERGFGVASGLFERIPSEPSFSLLAAQEHALETSCELWSPANQLLRRALEFTRASKTGIDRASPSLKHLLENGVEVIPLNYEDCETFTFRLVSDDKAQEEINAALRGARPLHQKFRPAVGDIVSAPYGDFGFLRAKIVQVDVTSCSVEFIDVGEMSSEPILLSSLKTHWKGRENILARWKPLAHRARHALIDLSRLQRITQLPTLSIAPASVGEVECPAQPPPSTAPNNNQAALLMLQLQQQPPANNPLTSLLTNYLLEKMESLVSIPQLRLYSAYEKNGIEHVFLKPTMEALDSSENVTFELKMWEDLLTIQHQEAVLDDSTPESAPLAQGSLGGGRRQAHYNQQQQQLHQQRQRPPPFIVDLDRGCLEFPSLARVVAQFLAVQR